MVQPERASAQRRISAPVPDSGELAHRAANSSPSPAMASLTTVRKKLDVATESLPDLTGGPSKRPLAPIPESDHRLEVDRGDRLAVRVDRETPDSDGVLDRGAHRFTRFQRPEPDGAVVANGRERLAARGHNQPWRFPPAEGARAGPRSLPEGNPRRVRLPRRSPISKVFRSGVTARDVMPGSSRTISPPRLFPLSALQNVTWGFSSSQAHQGRAVGRVNEIGRTGTIGGYRLHPRAGTGSGPRAAPLPRGRVSEVRESYPRADGQPLAVGAECQLVDRLAWNCDPTLCRTSDLDESQRRCPSPGSRSPRYPQMTNGQSRSATRRQVLQAATRPVRCHRSGRPRRPGRRG